MTDKPGINKTDQRAFFQYVRNASRLGYNRDGIGGTARFRQKLCQLWQIVMGKNHAKGIRDSLECLASLESPKSRERLDSTLGAVVRALPRPPVKPPPQNPEKANYK